MQHPGKPVPPEVKECIDLQANLEWNERSAALSTAEEGHSGASQSRQGRKNVAHRGSGGDTFA